MKRKMFSITTMASSMTMPTESVSASSVRLLSVNPMYWTTANAAMIEVGMASAAMAVARMLARKKNTTIAAMPPPMIKWCFTVSTEASMKIDWSPTTLTS